MTHTEALAHWRAALSEEFGLIITLASPDDKREIERVLYESRKNSGDESLQMLSLVKPGDRLEEIWIIKKTTDMRDII